MSMHDDMKEILITEEALQQRIKEMGADYHSEQ
jgi:hypoxanthine-guanine phosphoribosyltransferase